MKIRNVIHTSIADAIEQNRQIDMMQKKQREALKNQEAEKPSSDEPPLKKQKGDSFVSVETQKGDTQTPETLQRHADKLLASIVPLWKTENLQPRRVKELTEEQIKEGQDIARSI